MVAVVQKLNTVSMTLSLNWLFGRAVERIIFGKEINPLNTKRKMIRREKVGYGLGEI